MKPKFLARALKDALEVPSSVWAAVTSGLTVSPAKNLEPIGRELRITYYVLDIRVSHPSLNDPCIAARVCNSIAAGVPQHVRVDRKGPAARADTALRWTS
jgi:hypothetical protein